MFSEQPILVTRCIRNKIFMRKYLEDPSRQVLKLQPVRHFRCSMIWRCQSCSEIENQTSYLNFRCKNVAFTWLFNTSGYAKRMVLTFLETWHHEDYGKHPKLNCKTRMEGVAPTIIKDDFTNANQNEFERHQKCIRVADMTYIEKS